MNFQAMQRNLRTAKIGRGVFAGIAALLLTTNALLTAKLYTTSNQVVLVPTNISDGMVARGSVDKRYLEALALDAVYGLYNASPSSLAYGRQVIERVSAISERNNLLKHYDEVSTDIREREISTVFYPQQIEHNFMNLQVVVEGSLQTYLNTVLVSVEPRRIMLTFKPEAGSVRLSKINRLEVEQ